MGEENHLIQDCYDREGRFLGVWIDAVLWNRAEKELYPVLRRALEQGDESPREEAGEPLRDWELLKKHWDFAYPVDMDVACGECGNATLNWSQDSPRKFRLKAASLGGLVAYQCMSCRARVVKKHFKDHIQVQTEPFRGDGAGKTSRST